MQALFPCQLHCPILACSTSTSCLPHVPSLCFLVSNAKFDPQKPTVVRCQWFMSRPKTPRLRSEWMKVQIPRSPSGSRRRCAAASAPGIPMLVILLPFGFASKKVLRIGDLVRFTSTETANPCTVYSFQWSPSQNTAACNSGGVWACVRYIYSDI